MSLLKFFPIYKILWLLNKWEKPQKNILKDININHEENIKDISQFLAQEIDDIIHQLQLQPANS